MCKAEPTPIHPDVCAHAPLTPTTAGCLPGPKVVALVEKTASVVEALAATSPAKPLDPDLCSDYLTEVARVERMFTQCIEVLEEERCVAECIGFDWRTVPLLSALGLRNFHIHIRFAAASLISDSTYLCRAWHSLFLCVSPTSRVPQRFRQVYTVWGRDRGWR